MRLARALERAVDGPTRLVLEQPLARKLPRPDLVEDFDHLLARLLADDARPARQVAVLGRVAHHLAHPADAALVDEVDDELQFVAHLEVGHLGLIAGLDERLERGLDQRCRAAAQDHLLAEQVGLRLLGERGFEHAGARAADRLGVRERKHFRVAARVLLDGDRARDTRAGDVLAAQQIARPLRRDHVHVDVFRGLDLAEMDVEPVRKHERLARRHRRLDLARVDAGLHRVGQQELNDVALLCGLGRRHRREAVGFGARVVRGALELGDDDADAAVAHVLRLRVPLRAVADDGDRLALERAQVRIVVVVHLRHVSSSSFIDHRQRARNF